MQLTERSQPFQLFNLFSLPVASVIILTDSKVNQNYESIKQVRGLVHCGVCLSIAECDNLGPVRFD